MQLFDSHNHVDKHIHSLLSYTLQKLRADMRQRRRMSLTGRPTSWHQRMMGLRSQMNYKSRRTDARNQAVRSRLNKTSRTLFLCSCLCLATSIPWFGFLILISGVEENSAMKINIKSNGGFRNCVLLYWVLRNEDDYCSCCRFTVNEWSHTRSIPSELRISMERILQNEQYQIEHTIYFIIIQITTSELGEIQSVVNTINLLFVRGNETVDALQPDTVTVVHTVQVHIMMWPKARFPSKRNRLRCVRCVNENRKKRKRLRFLRFSFTQRTQRTQRKWLRLDGNRA